MEYREDLDKLATDTRAKAHELVLLQGACHPKGQTKPYYYTEKGSLFLLCGVCGKAVASIAVMSRPLAEPLENDPGEAMVLVDGPQELGESARKNRARKA